VHANSARSPAIPTGPLIDFMVIFASSVEKESGFLA